MRNSARVLGEVRRGLVSATVAQAMLKIGKHRGASFAAASCDRSYCAWVLREKDLAQGLRKFRAYLVDAHGGILNIGKHKGKFFDELVAEEENYCAWVLGLDDKGAFKDFVDYYMRAQNKKSQEGGTENPSKKRRVQEELDACKICFSSPIDSVLIPCGHHFACMACATRCEESGCPICKQQICFVQKTYRA